ncbi:MAG: YceH family protein [Nitrospirae bacterium]|nr:YceH family protein [Nitrospirota bacterium]
MELKLTEPEVRVLGCLIEKEMTTPDYYPLSLNALVNACNQKSSREPVVSYDEETVLSAIDSLKGKGLVWQSDLSRVSKYAHDFLKARNLVNKEAAIICVLFLRGQQTAAEIRERTDRLYQFNNVEEVKEILLSLEEMGYVKLLPRQHGLKEPRYTHLLTDVQEKTDTEITGQAPSPVQTNYPEDEHIMRLEEELLRLRQELEDLKRAFTEFKGQF